MILSESGGCGNTRATRSATLCETNHNEAIGLPYVMGTIGVWSMMDYFGEACSGKNILNITGPGPYTDWPTIFGRNTCHLNSVSPSASLLVRTRGLRRQHSADALALSLC